MTNGGNDIAVMEKLIINNFAGLQSVDIDVRPVTGLIGPQASGKSFIAKLLYFFREIGSLLPTAVNQGLDGAKYKAECLGRVFKIVLVSF